MNARVELAQSTFEPGSTLRGDVVLTGRPGERVQLSVFWFTEGKGDPDGKEILERELTCPTEERPSAIPFEVELPVLPVTYDGCIVKIGWAVEIRHLGEVIAKEPFVLRWDPR
ncbi:MAG: hypothetical protein U0414_06090 [Polyangiaceae bacterium]